jgi:hypothetical protein
MLGFSPLSGRGISALPADGGIYATVACFTDVEAAFANPLADLVQDPNANLVWSVELGANAIGAGTNQTIYAATYPFISRTGDTPANQPFDGTLKANIIVHRSIVGATGFEGSSDNVSELTLINDDAEYDDLTDGSSINGQPIVCKVGSRSGDVVDAYTDFVTIASLIGERWSVSRGEVVIESRDLTARLDVPVLTSIYAGTGELEGDIELQGQRRPKGFGIVFNATPALVIGAEGLFQLNDGHVASIDAVRDGGIALTYVGDSGTVDNLRASVEAGFVPPGSWAAATFSGYFAIGGVAFKQVTCDFTTTNTTTADIIKQVALTAGELVESDLDLHTFADINTKQGAPIGYYLDSGSNETCNTMFERLMAGIGGWHGISTLGKLQVRRLDAPSGIASEYYDISGGNLIDLDRANLPSGIDPPPRRFRVAYDRNWTIQTELFGQVSEDDPEFANELGQPHKLVTTESIYTAAILNDYPYAPDPEPVESWFVDEADAIAEEVRLRELYTSNFKLFRARLANALLMHQIGEEIAIRDNGIVARVGLTNYRYCVVVECRDDTRTGVSEVLLFG